MRSARVSFRKPRMYYHAPMRILLLTIVCASAALADDKQTILKQMDARAAHYGDVSRKIWDFAEVGYKEHKSAELLKSELRQAGFTVEDNVAEIPTAFTASWGQGKPVIAVLGEYDALPALSQDTIRMLSAVAYSAHGRRVGNNLLSSASPFPYMSIKDCLAAERICGT